MTRMWRGPDGLPSVFALAAAKPAATADIKILSGSAIEPAMLELIPKFEQSTGNKVNFDFDGTIGAMTQRVREGETADVLIVSGPQIATLVKENKILAGSWADIAKVGVGVSARSRHSSARCWRRNRSAGTIPPRARPSAFTCWACSSASAWLRR